MEENKHWYQTESGMRELLKLVNEKFKFDKEGNIYCRECKNESIACVCMGEDEDG